MKIIIAVLVAFASLQASAALVTERVCGLHPETSNPVCYEVTYEVRPASEPVVVACGYETDAGFQPCAKEYGVPRWLKALGRWFEKRGIRHNEVMPHEDGMRN